VSITHARVERCTVTQAQELRSEPLQTMVLPARCSPAGLTDWDLHVADSAPS
jgi:hypothetical protein